MPRYAYEFAMLSFSMSDVKTLEALDTEQHVEGALQ